MALCLYGADSHLTKGKYIMEIEYYYTCKNKECRYKFGEVAKKGKDIEDVKCSICNSEVSLDLIKDGFRINF